MKRMKKRLVCLVLSFSLCLSAVGCASGGASGSAPAVSSRGMSSSVVQHAKPTAVELLDGKKVIFIGNSYTHFGNCVIPTAQSVYSQTERTGDQGYFHQLCAANGLNVTVTDFTYGGHTFDDFYTGACAADRGHDGLNHLDYLTDRDYDYVILQEGPGANSKTNILAECEPVMKLFRDVNPDTKFIFLVHQRVHDRRLSWRSSIKELDQAGVTVVDWGALVYDVFSGAVQVPGAVQTYNKNSFIVSQSESDGYHPNILTGYITALMTYCAITGESAVGQSYDFVTDASIQSRFGPFTFRQKYYTYNMETNFEAILNSAQDMNGLQQLADQYLAAKPYLEY